MKTQNKADRQPLAGTALHLSLISLAGNAALAGFKLYAGFAGSSAAMVADAAHSLSDLVSTGIAWIGAHAAGRPADVGHPFGHERLESAAALLLAAVLAAAGAGIAWQPLQNLLGGGTAARPEPVALAAAAVSILVKEWMFRYTLHQAELAGSQAFIADAWHHRSDALSSVATLIGVSGCMLGFAVLDAVASLAVCALILKAAWEIACDALGGMLDASLGTEFEQQAQSYAASLPGVVRVDALRSRRFGSRAYVEVEIGVDARETFEAAHAVAEQVHTGLEETFPRVKHVTVHANPVELSPAGRAGGNGSSALC